MELIPTQKIINRDGIKAVKNGQKANLYSSVPNQKKPDWIRVKATFDANFKAVKKQVQDKRLNTVCEEAMCPNISECWSAGTATFMLMGSVCTRACKFCSVDTGNPKRLVRSRRANAHCQSCKDHGPKICCFNLSQQR